MDAPANRDVVVVAATASPWLLDAETLRRFALRVRLPLPDAPARATIARTRALRWVAEEDLARFAEWEERWGASPFSDVLHEARELCRVQQRLAFALCLLAARGPPHLAAVPAECVALVCAEVSLSCPRADAAAAAGCSRQPCQS